MSKHLYGWILLTSLCFSNNTAYAEIYRWVDEQGNMHFGDRGHSNGQAEDISQDVRLKNLDYSAKRAEQSLHKIDLRQQAQTTETQHKQSQINPAPNSRRVNARVPDSD